MTSRAEQKERDAVAAKEAALAAQKKAEASEQRAITAEAKARGEAENARRNAEMAKQNAYNSNMLLASRDWDAGNVVHLQELLDRYRGVLQFARTVRVLKSARSIVTRTRLV